MTGQPGHAQEPCGGPFLSRAKEGHRQKLMDWLRLSDEVVPCLIPLLQP